MPDAPSEPGVSPETHKQVKDELSQLREMLATEKAKNQVHMERNRDLISSASEAQSLTGPNPATPYPLNPLPIRNRFTIRSLLATDCQDSFFQSIGGAEIAAPLTAERFVCVSV